MKGFIEEGAWISCSFDLAGTPREMQKESDRLVRYSSGDRLLTVDDKTTLQCFSCKSPAKFWGGLAAFVGGLVVGAALVLSGPVGWIALGSVVAVGVALGVSIITHDCSEPQGGGEWNPFHETTIIMGSKAILYQYSMLACTKGGLLMASESQQAAKDLSDEMKWNTRGELGLQVLSQAIYGFGTGVVSGGVGGAIYGGMTGTVFYAMGESDNKQVNTTGTIIEWTVFNGFIDKYTSLLAANKVAEAGTSTFGKAFAKAFLPGVVVSLLSTLIDNFIINKIEEHLEQKNRNIIEDISDKTTSTSGKSIVSETN